jgi:hypothetical protein
MTTQMQSSLSKQLAFNSGLVPLRKPQGVEEIKLFRIYIKTLRQAEEDYLSPESTAQERAEAEQTLFGIHLSPLPGVCRTLGIDPHAAKLMLIEWKAKGRIGDPIFGFLTQPGAVDRYEMGQGIDIPNLEVIHGQDEICKSVEDTL